MAPPTKRLRVGVIFGGRSGEHEVSLASAASVIRALDPEKYEAVPIGITKDGRWLAGSSAQKMLPDVLRSGQPVMLTADPNVAALVPMNENRSGTLRVDVVFPVLHGTFGEDGTVQGLLDLAGLPYVGSGVIGSSVGMDKDMQKRLFREAGLPVADFLAVARSRWESSREEVLKEAEKEFKYPIFVKPATLGSSVGMTKAHNVEELGPAIDLAAEFAQKIVLEKFIKGREIEVAVLGNDNPEAALPGEIIPHREYYDYEAKYLEEGTRTEVPAKLTPELTARFQEYAVKAFRCIECRGMARVDFFLEGGKGRPKAGSSRRSIGGGARIYLNELNTIPGFTSISMYPKMWEASGVSYRELISRLIELALADHADKARTKYAIELPEGAAGALQP